MTVSGGIGVHMTDLAAEADLKLPPLPEVAQAKIREVVPFASTRNPLDVTGQVANEPGVLRSSLETMVTAGDYGSVLVFLGHAGGVGSLEDALSNGIKEVAAKHPESVFACCTTSKKDPFKGSTVLAFPDPPRAINAIKACVFFAEQRGKHVPAAKGSLESVVRVERGRAYNEHDAKKLLREMGVATPEERLVVNAAQAASAARAIAGSVALKIVSADLLHKSDVGGVALGLTAESIESAATTMLARVAEAAPAARIDGLLVSSMVSGVECIVGVHPDPVFGPVVVVGLGGTAVELLQDVSRRFAPVSEREAHAMVRELRTFPLLDGYRGRPKADVDALVRAIAAISEFAAANASALEAFEVNPLMVGPVGQGAIAVDCVLTVRS